MNREELGRKIELAISNNTIVEELKDIREDFIKNKVKECGNWYPFYEGGFKKEEWTADMYSIDEKNKEVKFFINFIDIETNTINDYADVFIVPLEYFEDREAFLKKNRIEDLDEAISFEIMNINMEIDTLKKRVERIRNSYIELKKEYDKSDK